jgi:hypothetical protein
MGFGDEWVEDYLDEAARRKDEQAKINNGLPNSAQTNIKLKENPGQQIPKRETGISYDTAGEFHLK